MLWPLLGIFVLKELLMLIAGLILIKKKKRPCAAKWYGKVATILFYVSFVTIFALKAIWHYESMTLTGILLSVTAGFMIYAFLRYFQVFVHILRSDDPDVYKRQALSHADRLFEPHPKRAVRHPCGVSSFRAGYPESWGSLPAKTVLKNLQSIQNLQNVFIIFLR